MQADAGFPRYGSATAPIIAAIAINVNTTVYVLELFTPLIITIKSVALYKVVVLSQF